MKNDDDNFDTVSLNITKKEVADYVIRQESKDNVLISDADIAI